MTKEEPNKLRRWAYSGVQGIISGALIAQGGYNAAFLAFLSPLIDISALRSIVKRRNSGTDPLRPSKAVIAGCLGTNLIFAVLASNLVVPYSPWAAGTQRYYYKVMALPLTNGNHASILSAIDFLRSPAQKKWLHNAQFSNLEAKKNRAEAIQEQLRLQAVANQLEKYDGSKYGAWESFPPSLLAQLNPTALSDDALDGAFAASQDWGGRTRNGEEDSLNDKNRDRFVAESSRRRELFENSKEGKALAAKLAKEEAEKDSARLSEEIDESGVTAARIGVIQDLKEVRRQIVDKFLSKGLHGPEAAELAKQMMRDKSIAALIAAGASQDEAQRGWNYISNGIDANLNY